MSPLWGHIHHHHHHCGSIGYILPHLTTHAYNSISINCIHHPASQHLGTDHHCYCNLWSINRFWGILLIHDRVKMQFNAAIVTRYPDPWSLLSWKNQSFIIWSFEQNLNPLCNTGGHSHHRCHCVFSWCEGRWFDTVLDWFRSRNSSTNALWVKAHWEGSIQIFPFLHENITFTF